MMAMTRSLAADHAVCTAMLRASGSSFALPIRLLPEAKRRGTTALYAFCRRADDIVDDTPDTAAATVALDAFAAEVTGALAGAAAADPVIRALADTVRRFAIPADYVHEILAGVRMDLVYRTYDTFTELRQYCRRVAGAVGLAAIHIWGFRGSEALTVGDDCGLAFQLTNILRDVPEDLARGRVYIPAEDFLDAGCTVHDLRGGRIGPAFTRLAARQVARAADCYVRAAALDRLLSTDGRLAFRAMFGVYRSLFEAVRRAGPEIFVRRVRPPRIVMLGAAATTLFCGPGRAAAVFSCGVSPAAAELACGVSPAAADATESRGRS
jgi:phytoene synthase